MNRTLITTGSTFGLLVAVGALSTAMTGSADAQIGAGTGPGVGSEEAPEVIELSGIVRDFRERTHEGGHSDFEMKPTAGFGHYCGNVSPDLGPNGKPVFTGDGFKVSKQWKDKMGRNICWYVAEMYPAAGDEAGSRGVSNKGGIASEDSYDQWFRNVAGVNLSKEVTLKLIRQGDGSYVFDDKSDADYSSLGGFFPIEDQLFGNPGGSPDRNFHFTFELHTEFTYDADGAQVFTFIGDDDVWVFINGSLVIDLGGVHGATEQSIDLNRLALEDGETYALSFFFAERHRTQSNFRIQTNLKLESTAVPSITAAFD